MGRFREEDQEDSEDRITVWRKGAILDAKMGTLIRHPVTLEPRARGVAGRALISDSARDSNSHRFKDVILPFLYLSLPPHSASCGV